MPFYAPQRLPQTTGALGTFVNHHHSAINTPGHNDTGDWQNTHSDKFFRRGQKCLIFAILCVPIRL
ncbi:hypothetical protein EM595_0896 [Duffyella gerundensis]|uniref:Uncharacterized protein n=1 Tax=Duffyella gerundensis TaxID=1619313 RepID=A0A0U5LLD7_9GAMM|nr:hypothetical protein EM595_0896 [Duffyella gerundensis]